MDEILNVECPSRTCKAKIGESCRTSIGTIRSEPHGLRWLNTFEGPLTRCPHGTCEDCRWTGWVDGRD